MRGKFYPTFEDFQRLRTPKTLESSPIKLNCMLNQVSQTMIAKADDSFELYDLRVEVVCPPDERILCGAKNGDHFTLQGEMLHLSPGQGFSIYSLGVFKLLLSMDENGLRKQHPYFLSSQRSNARPMQMIGCNRMPWSHVPI